MSVFNPGTGAIDSIHNPASGDSPSGTFGRAEIDDSENAAIVATQTYLAQLWNQVPFASLTAVGAPTSGTWQAGRTYVDANGKLWVCTVAGTPGTWMLGGAGELGFFETTTATTTTAGSGTAVATALTKTVTTGVRPVYVTYGSLISASSAAQIGALELLLDGVVVDVASVELPTAGENSWCGTTKRLTPAAGSHTFSVSILNFTTTPAGTITMVDTASTVAARLYITQQ